MWLGKRGFHSSILSAHLQKRLLLKISRIKRSQAQICSVYIMTFYDFIYFIDLGYSPNMCICLYMTTLLLILFANGQSKYIILKTG